MAGDEAHFSSPKRSLDARHLRPRKRFGQNFLTDPRVAERIARVLPADAYVIEVGGGTGALTAALLQRARSVTCLEIDRGLSAILRERFAGQLDRLRIITQDVLQFDLAADLREREAPRAVCGNLPYYITTPIIERTVEASGLWDSSVFMVQREYARRLVARAGSPEYGSLTVFAAYFCSVEKLFDVGAAGFYPAPRVSSSVVRLTPKAPQRVGVCDEGLLLWLIRAAFGQRRKTLVNSVLARIPGETPRMRKIVESALQTVGLAATVRGERLTLADFCALADALAEQGFVEIEWTTPPKG